MKYSRNQNYVLRNIHGSYFLIDITDNYKDDKCRLIEINEVGEFIWSKLTTELTINELTDELLAVLIDDVPYDMIYNDIKEYLEIMNAKEIIVKRSA